MGNQTFFYNCRCRVAVLGHLHWKERVCCVTIWWISYLAYMSSLAWECVCWKSCRVDVFFLEAFIYDAEELSTKVGFNIRIERRIANCTAKGKKKLFKVSLLSLSKDSVVNFLGENLSNFCQFILVFNCDLRINFQTLTRILFLGKVKSTSQSSGFTDIF